MSHVARPIAARCAPAIMSAVNTFNSIKSTQGVALTTASTILLDALHTKGAAAAPRSLLDLASNEKRSHAVVVNTKHRSTCTLAHSLDSLDLSAGPRLASSLVVRMPRRTSRRVAYYVNEKIDFGLIIDEKADLASIDTPSTEDVVVPAPLVAPALAPTCAPAPALVAGTTTTSSSIQRFLASTVSTTIDAITFGIHCITEGFDELDEITAEYEWDSRFVQLADLTSPRQAVARRFPTRERANDKRPEHQGIRRAVLKRETARAAPTFFGDLTRARGGQARIARSLLHIQRLRGYRTMPFYMRGEHSVYDRPYVPNAEGKMVPMTREQVWEVMMQELDLGNRRRGYGTAEIREWSGPQPKRTQREWKAERRQRLAERYAYHDAPVE